MPLPVFICVFVLWTGKRVLISAYNNLSWETVFTAGFELDVIRRKRPYKWSIWVCSRVTLCIIWDLTTISTKTAIPWNPLHRVTCLRLLISLYRRPRRFLSGKTLATPGFMADSEIIIDIHLLVIVVHKSLLCKGAVTITHSLPFNETLTHRRWAMPLGHSPPSSLLSACKSFP